MESPYPHSSFRPPTGRCLLGLTCIGIAVLGELSVPDLVGNIVDRYPAAIGWGAFWILAGALAAHALGLGMSRWIFSIQGARAVFALRAALGEAALEKGPWVSHLAPGEWSQRFGMDARSVSFLSGGAWLMGGTLSLTIAISFLRLCFIAWLPAILAAVAWLSLALFLFRIASKENQAFHDIQSVSASFSTSIVECFRWIKQIKLSGQELELTSELLQESEALAEKTWRARHLGWLGESFGLVIASLTAAIALSILVSQALRGEVSIGRLMSFLSLLALGGGAAAQVPAWVTGLRRGRVGLERCLKSLREAKLNSENAAKMGLGSIELPLELRLGKPDSVAVTGPVGSGKSVLLRRWFQNRADAIFVPQEPALFSGSIRENLTLAEDFPEGLLWQALEWVELDHEVRQMKAGLETPLGEGGAGLSSGQKQRLALARAILRKPRNLILDDCLSGVDPQRGQRISERLSTFGHELTLALAGQNGWWLRAGTRQICLAADSEKGKS